ncbi:MAG TPA: hypothetical protein EYP61_04790 [Candidatus Latescibacteria bacterium]|nr:hypothetical protein [Candidatus Latescibacterota bacterium]
MRWRVAFLTGLWLSCGGGGGHILEDGRIYIWNGLEPTDNPAYDHTAIATFYDEDLSTEVVTYIPPGGNKKPLGADNPEYGSQGKLFGGGTRVSLHIRAKENGDPHWEGELTVDGNMTVRVVRILGHESGVLECQVTGG